MLAGYILLKHGEICPRIECHAAQDECFQWFLMKSAPDERVVWVFRGETVSSDALGR